MAVTDQNPEADINSLDEIAETVKRLQETDLVVINGDTRTYHVTDVVEQAGDDADNFSERYVIRLEWRRDDGRLALVLEEGAKTKIEVHVLQDDRLPGEGEPTTSKWSRSIRRISSGSSTSEIEIATIGLIRRRRVVERPNRPVGWVLRASMRNSNGGVTYIRGKKPVHGFFGIGM